MPEPWASRMLLTMASPSPTPPNRRVVELSTWWNRWKIRPSCSAGMPMPVSCTRISAPDRPPLGARKAVTLIWPPSGVNLIALMTRFSSTAAIFSRSAMTGGSDGSTSAAKRRRFLSSSERTVTWIWSTRAPRLKGWMLRTMRPISIREKSSSALMDFDRRSRFRWTTTSPFSCLSETGPSFRSRM